jgi:tetratricopeptide (TPR) repeat protein
MLDSMGKLTLIDLDIIIGFVLLKAIRKIIGRLDEALNESYSALSFLPYEPNIHFYLANALGKLNRYEDSERHFLYAIKLSPSIARYHYNLGK